MNEIEAFLQKIEQFIVTNGMSASNFGHKFANDPLFVFQVRDGREPRLKTRSRILKNMENDQTEGRAA